MREDVGVVETMTVGQKEIDGNCCQCGEWG